MKPVDNKFTYPSQEAIQVGVTRLPVLPSSEADNSFSRTLKTVLDKPSKNNAADRQDNFTSLVEAKAKKYSINPKLLWSVIKAESDFRPNLTSPAGAQGLMQLMPETAKELGVANPFDPEQNVEGGAKYLRSLLDRYNGNVSLALAAYNAGPANVARYGGIPPFSETRNYVAKILGLMDA